MSKPTVNQAYFEDTAAIYSEDYAAAYPSLYIAPWKAKHDLNVRNLEDVFQTLVSPIPDWLDLACGQAWHFSMFPARARMLGLDLSAAQLRRARLRVPNAVFMEGDMVSRCFPKASFDLVTHFWAGYCYLGTNQRIMTMLSKAVRWIRTGGAFYMEVLLARDLEAFNRSNFARQTGFNVMPRSHDYRDWQYDDVGGHHEMTSPPLEFFLDFLTPAFGQINVRHDGAFMVHLIATGRKHHAL